MNIDEAKKRMKKKIDLNKMPMAEARVAIAQDVIAQLRLKRMKARSSYGYVDFKLNLPEKTPVLKKDIVDLQDLIGEKHAVCTVCGIGSLFIADVFRRNDEELDVEKSFGERYVRFIPDRGDVAGRLGQFFEQEQLNLIEQAFEGCAGVFGAEPRTDDAIAFGKRYARDTIRLIAIMKNIIKNEGTFIP